MTTSVAQGPNAPDFPDDRYEIALGLDSAGVDRILPDGGWGRLQFGSSVALSADGQRRAVELRQKFAEQWTSTFQALPQASMATTVERLVQMIPPGGRAHWLQSVVDRVAESTTVSAPLKVSIVEAALSEAQALSSPLSTASLAKVLRAYETAAKTAAKHGNILEENGISRRVAFALGRLARYVTVEYPDVASAVCGYGFLFEGGTDQFRPTAENLRSYILAANDYFGLFRGRRTPAMTLWKLFELSFSHWGLSLLNDDDAVQCVCRKLLSCSARALKRSGYTYDSMTEHARLAVKFVGGQFTGHVPARDLFPAADHATWVTVLLRRCDLDTAGRVAAAWGVDIGGPVTKAGNAALVGHDFVTVRGLRERFEYSVDPELARKRERMLERKAQRELKLGHQETAAEQLLRKAALEAYLRTGKTVETVATVMHVGNPGSTPIVIYGLPDKIVVRGPVQLRPESQDLIQAARGDFLTEMNLRGLSNVPRQYVAHGTIHIPDGSGRAKLTLTTDKDWRAGHSDIIREKLEKALGRRVQLTVVAAP